MNERVLFTEKEISENLDKLANQIETYISTLPENEQDKIIFIGLLTGCIHFVSDLTKKVESDHKLAFMKASSYINNKRGSLTIDENIPTVKDHHVIVLDDICDSGNTLNAVVNKLLEHKPLSVKTCVLVNKILPEKSHTPDYTVFNINDVFIYGYGLDYDEYKRNLRDIRIKID